MSYALISNISNFNKDNVELSKIYQKTFDKELNTTFNYYVFNTQYSYDKVGNDKLKIMSPTFMKILYVPRLVKNNFVFYFQKENNYDFMVVIDNIISKIKYDIMKQFPDMLNSDIESFDLTSSYKSHISNTGTNIKFHKSKSKGGGIVSLGKTDKITDIMPLFKYSKYGKEIIGETNIHYVGKFIFSFNVIIHENIDNTNNEKKYKCEIRMIVDELEIKHNVSFVKQDITSNIKNIVFNSIKPSYVNKNKSVCL